MGVIRVEKNKDFSVMSNYHLRDKNLSLKAKGLLSQILSLPPSWNYTIEGLTSICLEGKSAIRSAIEELEKAGYIVREQIHSGDGTFGGYDYTVFEVPPQSPSSENRTMDKKRAPSCGFPSSDKPSSDNRTQLNTNRLNTNNTPIAPRGGRREPKKEPDWKPERFKVFWKIYPRGENKQAAIRAWDKLRPDEATMIDMSDGLNRQLESEEWNRGIGIPYASSWLNGRRWEDEVKKPRARAKAPSECSWEDDEEVRYD